MVEPVKETAVDMGELAAASLQAANLLAALSARSKERGHDSTAPSLRRDGPAASRRGRSGGWRSAMNNQILEDS